MLSAPPNPSRNVYVASLPLTLNDAELMNMFASYGVVLSAKIMREKKTRQSKGYGFVLFQTEDAAASAVRGMSGLLVGSSRLQVRLAHLSACKDLAKQCRSVPQCASFHHRPPVSSMQPPTMAAPLHQQQQQYAPPSPVHMFQPPAMPLYVPIVIPYPTSMSTSGSGLSGLPYLPDGSFGW